MHLMALPRAARAQWDERSSFVVKNFYSKPLDATAEFAMRNLITILTGTKCGTIGIRQYGKAIAGVVLSLGMRVASLMRFSARYAVCYAPVNGHVVHPVAVRSQLMRQQQALGLLASRLGWHPTSSGSARRGRED